MIRRLGLALILLLTISAPLAAQIAQRGDVFYGDYEGLPTGVPKDYILWIYMDGGPCSGLPIMTARGLRSNR